MIVQTINLVISAFSKHLQTVGACSVIHTVAGYQFRSATFHDCRQIMGASHRISIASYPQSNCLAERLIRSVKTALLPN